MKDHLIELIHKEMEGIITPSEKQELEQALKKDPELRRLQQELKQTGELLGQITPLEPSPNLKKKIIDAIDFSRYSYRAEEPDWISRFMGWLWTPKIRFVYAIAAGIVIGITISLLLIGSPLSTQQIPVSELYGTIGVDNKNFETIKKLTIDQEGWHGTFTLNSYRNMFWFELNLQSDQVSEIHFIFNEKLISFTGLRPIEWGTTVLENQPSMVKLIVDRQGHGLILFHKLSADPSPITLNLLQSEKVVFTEEFVVGNVDNKK